MKSFSEMPGRGRSHPGDPSRFPGTLAPDHSEGLLLIGELSMEPHLVSTAPLPRGFQDGLGTVCDSKAPF